MTQRSKEWEKGRDRALEWAERDRGSDTPLAWFEELYSAAKGNLEEIPWEDQRSQPLFTDWLNQKAVDGTGKRALVIGCGLGDDCEELAARGFDVTGFDLSATAIAWAQERFEGTSVRYLTADLLDLPAELSGSFDLVVEIYTLQAMPQEFRPRAFDAIAGTLASGASLFVLCRGRENDEPVDNVPWPLSRADLAEYNMGLLDLSSFEDLLDDEDPPVRRFRVVFGLA